MGLLGDLVKRKWIRYIYHVVGYQRWSSGALRHLHSTVGSSALAFGAREREVTRPEWSSFYGLQASRYLMAFS